jgi:putative ABC transport system substrate-binding protein
MRRRTFIAALGGAMTTPLAVRAQQRMRRVGVLIGVADDAEGRARVSAFKRGMQELGWIEGRNVQIDARFMGGKPGQVREHTIELLGADVFVANSSPAVRALQAESPSTPIVFAQVIDPVSMGFVQSLAKPGGNITGFVSFDYSIGAKWLEILKEIAPQVVRVGVLRDPTVAGPSGQLGAIQGVAPFVRVEVSALDVREAAAIDKGIDDLAATPNSGLIVLASPTATVNLDRIVSSAARHRLPAIYPYRFYVEAGGLISYGVDHLDLYRRAASYVDRIFKGERAADLPVQQPTKFHLAINSKTARSLGITVPPTLLTRADEVIE